MSLGNSYARPGETHAARVLSALKSGPKYIADITGATSLTPHQASNAAKILVRRGLAQRLDDGRGRALYGPPRKDSPIKPRPFRNEVARQAEDQYVTLRKAGIDKLQAADRLGLTITAAEAFEDAYRFQGMCAYTPDSTTPKFADHDRHICDVMRAGGYPALSERPVAPVGHGLWTTCLPVVWPERRAA